MTEQHECVFAPMFAECLCGRRLTIGELCKRANATERLSAERAKYIGEDGRLYSKDREALSAYADILEGK